jgi:thioredoxin 1
MVAPIVDAISEEHPEIKVGKVNVDEENQLATAFGVMSIPSLFVLKNGEVVNQAVGARTKAQILDMLK